MRCLGFAPNEAPGRFLILALISASLCWAQSDAQKLADQARGLPPEFAADLLFRLGQPESLDDISALAAGVQNPIQMDDVVGWTDTLSWSTGRASALHLDKLAIQCRVVQHMLSSDPQRARQLFFDIAVPAIDPPACETALVADPSIYFDTAGPFGLERPLRSMSSAVQLPAAARALRMLPGTNEQRQLLLDIYVARLAELSDSPRATGFALTGLQLPAEVVQLAEDLKKQGLAVDSLLTAYRKFLVRYSSGERCADTKVQPVIDSFNDRLRWGGYLAAQDLPRITEEEAKPAKLDRRAKVVQYWHSDDAKRLLSAVRHLRFGDGSKPLTADQKASEAWEIEAKALLASLDGWKTDSFHERAILYASLLELLPRGNLHENAAQSALAFLAESDMKSSRPLEWLLELNSLISLNQPEIARAMRASKDPILLLYGTITYRK